MSLSSIFKNIWEAFVGGSENKNVNKNENQNSSSSNPVQNVTVNLDVSKSREVESSQLPSNISKKLEQEIQGEWNYTCILDGKVPYFPDDKNGKGNAHGGTCSIKTIKGERFTEVRVSGKRKWNATGRRDTFEISNKRDVDSLRRWDSYEGAFIDENRIEYKYHLSAEGVDGVSNLLILYDKNTLKLSLTGEFHYYVEEYFLDQNYLDEIEGVDNFEKMLKAKRKQVYRLMRGVIQLTDKVVSN